MNWRKKYNREQELGPVMRMCPECDGSGKVEVTEESEDANIGGIVIGTVDCDRCEGLGEIIDERGE
jgi:DnaJ-class molecular chaperone